MGRIQSSDYAMILDTYTHIKVTGDVTWCMVGQESKFNESIRYI